VQVFNTVIKRASEAGNTAAAQSAYAQMCAAGVAPSAATFSALLSALRSHHSAAEAVEMAADLASQADAAKGVTIGMAGLALLDACHLNGWSDVSLQLLARVEEAGGSPGLDMLNSVLAACAKGGSVAEVRQAFEALERHGVEPSPASYQHVVQALCGAGQWAEAAQTYRDMLASGCERRTLPACAPCRYFAMYPISLVSCAQMLPPGPARTRSLPKQQQVPACADVMQA
jgi:pentatricopeptide repeat protein